MATRKRNNTQTKTTLLLVTATEAEALYFSQMRKDCRYGNLTVVNSGATSLKALVTFTVKEKSISTCDGVKILRSTRVYQKGLSWMARILK